MFRFTTGDGATLVGLVLGTGRTGLVLGHQLGSDLCEWLPQARAFAKDGYRVLVFDFAAWGVPARAGRTGDNDVVAAAAQLAAAASTRSCWSAPRWGARRCCRRRPGSARRSPGW